MLLLSKWACELFYRRTLREVSTNAQGDVDISKRLPSYHRSGDVRGAGTPAPGDTLTSTIPGLFFLRSSALNHTTTQPAVLKRAPSHQPLDNCSVLLYNSNVDAFYVRLLADNRRPATTEDCVWHATCANDHA